MKLGTIKRKRIVFGILLGFLALVVFDYWTFPLLSSAPRSGFDQARNGIWLRYPWYFGEHSPSEVAALGKRLNEDRFAYAYFHVRDVKPDGSLRYPHFAEAIELNRVLDVSTPSLRRIAWVYVGNAKGRGAVRLMDSPVRKRLVSEAARLVKECGFHGIQWDYEICDDGEPGLLHLLEDSRKALPDGSFLGVAAPASYPWPLGRVSWSDAYFRKVAERCNQIAVMAYDSGLYHPRFYSSLVARQAEVLGRACEGTACRFVIGVPTYEDGTLSHNPRAENLKLALRAVRSGLSAGMPYPFEGVGIFADYTTDSEEWAVYRRDWLGLQAKMPSIFSPKTSVKRKSLPR